MIVLSAKNKKKYSWCKGLLIFTTSFFSTLTIYILATFFYIYSLLTQLTIFEFFEKKSKESLKNSWIKSTILSIHFLHSGKVRSFIWRAHALRCADEQPAVSDDTSWICYVRHYGLSFARRSRRWSRKCVLTSRNNCPHRSLCPYYSYNYLQNNLPCTPRLWLYQPCDACPSTMDNCLSNASWYKRRPRARVALRRHFPLGFAEYHGRINETQNPAKNNIHIPKQFLFISINFQIIGKNLIFISPRCKM